jgi:hypothetical protein
MTYRKKKHLPKKGKVLSVGYKLETTMQKTHAPMSVQFPAWSARGVDCDYSEDVNALIDKTRYWVQATGFEMQALWEKWAKDAVQKRCESDEEEEEQKKAGNRCDWQSDNVTRWLIIGVSSTDSSIVLPAHIVNDTKRADALTPMLIEIASAEIDGVTVGFYRSFSQIVHWDMVKHFLALHSLSFRCGLHSDVWNFNINRVKTEVDRFEFANNLVALTKRKSPDEDVELGSTQECFGSKPKKCVKPEVIPQ